MTGKAFDWKKICKIHFGAYAQVHEDRNFTNTLEERRQGAICLGPIGNLQGTYNLFLLRSGKKITCGQLKEVPTPKIVMKQVAAMALDEKQNEVLIFENRAGATVNDIFPDDEANEEFNRIYGNITGVDCESDPPEQEIQEPAVHILYIQNNEYVALADNDDYNKNEDDQ